MIPVYQMEEHHEAYYIWHLALAEGRLPQTGNLLLHVDHHDDLECGFYARDFTQPMGGPEQALEFVRRDLGVADFIVPAFWDGLFDEMINFTSIFAQNKAPQEKVVRLGKQGSLIFRDAIPLVDSGADSAAVKPIRYTACSLSPVEITKPVVLDIDLDYFCWDNTLSTQVPAMVEVTEQTWNAFVEDPHHPFRITARHLFNAKKENGRFYIEMINLAGKPKVTKPERIHQRVEKFLTWLKENNIQPQIIDICRSRLSGYCPADRWQLVEQAVLKGLAELYPIEVQQTKLTLKD